MTEHYLSARGAKLVASPPFAPYIAERCDATFGEALAPVRHRLLSHPNLLRHVATCLPSAQASMIRERITN
jgi:hypothetical protein